MDYRAWGERTFQFVERFKRQHPVMKSWVDIHPPATPDQVAELEGAVGRRMPAELRAFLLTASGGCGFGYWWEARADDQVATSLDVFGTKDIAGGLESFCDLKHMARDYHEGCRDLLELVESGWGEAPCKDPLPIGSLGNGDYLVLDLASDGPSTPVIHLARDDQSYALAPDFDTFLKSWETICYLDPDMDRPFSQFIDKQGGGILTADTTALRQLKALLSPRD